jgi:hypothetical protein
MEDLTNTAPSAAPESSAPVSDTSPSNAGPTSTPATPSDRPSRARGRSKPAAPKTTEEKFSASMEAIYDRFADDVQQPSTDRLTPTDPAPQTPASLGSRVDPQLWAQTPPQVRDLISQREHEVQQLLSRQGRELSELRKGNGASELGAVMDKYQGRIPNGPDGAPMAPAAVLNSLLKAHDMLESNPMMAIAFLAQNYGVSLAALGQDPEAVSMQQQQMASYQQAMAQAQQHAQQLQQQQQQLQQQRQQYFQRELENFIKERSEYWSSDLEDEVVRQVDAVKAQNPSLFAMDPLTVVRQAESRAKKIVGIQTKQDQIEARKKADEARRLASLNVKTRAGSSPTNASKDIWSNDNWHAAYDRAQRSR